MGLKDVTAWLALPAAVFALFAIAEQVVRDDVRRSVSEWLSSRRSDTSVRLAPSRFIGVFDDVFGRTHATRFARSSLASLLTVAIVTVVLSSGAHVQAGLSSMNATLLVTYIGVAGINVVADYISLVETRVVLGLMGTGPRVNSFALVLTVSAV